MLRTIPIDSGLAYAHGRGHRSVGVGVGIGRGVVDVDVGVVVPSACRYGCGRGGEYLTGRVEAGTGGPRAGAGNRFTDGTVTIALRGKAEAKAITRSSEIESGIEVDGANAYAWEIVVEIRSTSRGRGG